MKKIIYHMHILFFTIQTRASVLLEKFLSSSPWLFRTRALSAMRDISWRSAKPISVIVARTWTEPFSSCPPATFVPPRPLNQHILLYLFLRIRFVFRLTISIIVACESKSFINANCWDQSPSNLEKILQYKLENWYDVVCFSFHFHRWLFLKQWTTQ